MRAAVYARVSTEDQAREGFSILSSRTACIPQGQGLDGRRGRGRRIFRRTIDRPAYQRMMGKVGRSPRLKMDRIHRNSQNFAAMMDSLNAWKKAQLHAGEFDTTTAMGRFVMDTIQRIAQLEAQIGERVKVGDAKAVGPYLGSAYPSDDIAWAVGAVGGQAEVVLHLSFIRGRPGRIAVALNERTPTKKGKRRKDGEQDPPNPLCWICRLG